MGPFLQSGQQGVWSFEKAKEKFGEKEGELKGAIVIVGLPLEESGE